MTNPENLPIKVANRDVVVASKQSGSLVARGLVAIQNSKGLAPSKNDDKLYRQARMDFDQAEVESDYSFTNWSKKGNSNLFSGFEIFQQLARKNYGKAYYPLSVLCGGQDLHDLIDHDEATRLRLRAFGGTQNWGDQVRKLFEIRSQDLAQLAFKWCLANQTNVDVELWCDLGDMYRYGHGVAVDRGQAAIWFRKAAEQGHMKSQYMMGEVTEDRAKAVQWYLLAANQGDAPAQTKLGICYQYGEGVTRDDAKAVKWYRKAAKQGNGMALIMLKHLPTWHKSSVIADEAKSERWYLKAANQGDADAQYIMGNLCSMGLGAKQDDTKAAQWYCKAASQGHEDAQIELRNLGLDWNQN